MCKEESVYKKFTHVSNNFFKFLKYWEVLSRLQSTWYSPLPMFSRSFFSRKFWTEKQVVATLL